MRVSLVSMSASQNSAVMAGLLPAIHELASGSEDVDARNKPGHDEIGRCAP
jgi:hypothetical protein